MSQKTTKKNLMLSRRLLENFYHIISIYVQKYIFFLKCYTKLNTLLLYIVSPSPLHIWPTTPSLSSRCKISPQFIPLTTLLPCIYPILHTYYHVNQKETARKGKWRERGKKESERRAIKFNIRESPFLQMIWAIVVRGMCVWGFLTNRRDDHKIAFIQSREGLDYYLHS